MDDFDLDKRDLECLIRFGTGYLKEKGWYASAKSGGLSKNDYEDLPHYTYPAIRFIERLIKKDFNIFEYGIGGSSIWWAKRANRVVSVEHNKEWKKAIESHAPENLEIVLKEREKLGQKGNLHNILKQFIENNNEHLSGDVEHDVEHGLEWLTFQKYTLSLTNFPKGFFDVIVIDGMARSLTAWLAGQYISETGFIVFDDTHRWQYNPGLQTLKEQGFGLIDFWGPGPVNDKEWCTSVAIKNISALTENFIRDQNTVSDLTW